VSAIGVLRLAPFDALRLLRVLAQDDGLCGGAGEKQIPCGNDKPRKARAEANTGILRLRPFGASLRMTGFGGGAGERPIQGSFDYALRAPLRMTAVEGCGHW